MQETLTPNTARPAGSPSRAHVWPRDAAPSGPSSKVAFPCVCLCEEKLYKGEAGRLVSRSEKRVHGRCACGGNSVWGGGIGKITIIKRCGCDASDLSVPESCMPTATVRNQSRSSPGGPAAVVMSRGRIGSNRPERVSRPSGGGAALPLPLCTHENRPLRHDPANALHVHRGHHAWSGRRARHRGGGHYRPGRLH